MRVKFLRPAIVMLAFIVCLSPCALLAQSPDHDQGHVDVLPAKNVKTDASGASYEYAAEADTDPAIKLTPDKSDIIRLEKPVGTVIVGNPAHLNVLAENPQTLVLVGRQPGATHFIALDRSGKVIMQRSVLVASPQDHYIRVRKTCAGLKKEECQATQVYYCPDTCHAIAIQPDQQDSGGAQGAEQTSKAAQEAVDATTGGQPAPLPGQ